MRELCSDELFLRGRLQVSTAIGALAHSGVNPEAQKRLQTFLEVHDTMRDGQAQNDLSIYVKGKTAEREKSDIVSSLELLFLNPTIENEQRVASAALYTILK